MSRGLGKWERDVLELLEKHPEGMTTVMVINELMLRPWTRAKESAIRRALTTLREKKAAFRWDCRDLSPYGDSHGRPSWFHYQHHYERMQTKPPPTEEEHKRRLDELAVSIRGVRDAMNAPTATKPQKTLGIAKAFVEAVYNAFDKWKKEHDEMLQEYLDICVAMADAGSDAKFEAFCANLNIAADDDIRQSMLDTGRDPELGRAFIEANFSPGAMAENSRDWIPVNVVANAEVDKGATLTGSGENQMESAGISAQAGPPA